ncbi:hypothetical protein RclHR1_05850001 [Rhizophagus clarus]|uniref:F-box domain-containing protein n=1 Tax=Rhizophagus clarus TaxID=94130 RepID=A0A2Z6S7N7_9GLOM|nr:hypothetical protein RclHR1_05850001 [Rhizophagus clarus]GES74696.1 hypothetical protein GLOIN_2v1783316 [Rhizophagus clarus]
MSNLNSDVLHLIFEQVQDDKKALYSCLLVNKIWCETTVPILWKNPWKCLINRENEKLLLGIIISHLSNASRNKIREHNLLSDFHQKLSFNYISYCRHLDLDEILRIIDENIDKKSIMLSVQDEILNLFINEDMKFTHLYMRKNFEHQIHLFYGVERCFSEIEFLSCSTSINNNILTKLAEACKSIKELKLFIDLGNNNCRIVKLIEVQRRLFNIDLHYAYGDEPFYKILEDSLIKHAGTIQYCKVNKLPSANFLSSFVNLKELDFDNLGFSYNIQENYLENLSFPFLQILKSSNVSIKILTDLIKNTSGNLIEIKIDYISHDEIDNKKLIQVIYQKCPNIKYLTLLIRNCNILELEILLISCQQLSGLYLLIDDLQDSMFDWDKLYEMLTRSSPTNLFKFIFHCYELPALETFKLFFDNWKERHPNMFLKIIYDKGMNTNTLIERYKSEGIVVNEYISSKRTEDFV